MPWSIKLLTTFLRFSPRAPRENTELKILYLTHLSVDFGLSLTERQLVFGELISSIFTSGRMRNYTFLSHCDQAYDSFLPALKNYYCHSVPMGIFEVHARDLKPARLPARSWGFEMAMV
jgi:hypothetical protein